MSSPYHCEESGTCGSWIKKLYVNGEELSGNYIPQEKLTGETEIEFYMS